MTSYCLRKGISSFFSFGIGDIFSLFLERRCDLHLRKEQRHGNALPPLNRYDSGAVFRLDYLRDSLSLNLAFDKYEMT
jgi:hypothetical protein